MADKTEREKAQTNITENRKAFHDYHVLETFEAGIVLLGTEIKAIREGRVNLRDSFARLEAKYSSSTSISARTATGVTPSTNRFAEGSSCCTGRRSAS